MAGLNRMATLVGRIRSSLPSGLQPWALSLMFNSQIKLAGTAGIRVEQLTSDHAVLKIPNVRKVQNHIGGVHACGMALVAESATGILMAMNVPDDKLPLCKTMAIDFRRRAQGGLMAVATLTEDQRAAMRDLDKGDATVQVTVTDESGKEPIEAKLVWAWVPKKPKA